MGVVPFLDGTRCLVVKGNPKGDQTPCWGSPLETTPSIPDRHLFGSRVSMVVVGKHFAFLLVVA